MNPSGIGSYIPASFFQDGKQEAFGRVCQEAFAMLDCRNRIPHILASRGAPFEVDTALKLEQEELIFLQAALQSDETSEIVLLFQDRALILFPQLFAATGLCPALLPYAKVDMILHCLSYFDRPAPRLSPMIQNKARRHAISSEAETCYAMLCEQLSSCDGLLMPNRTLDFRLHCAQIAYFCACRTDVTSMPTGSFPIGEQDRLRWTAFLLCCFLSLRGDSARGPELELEEAHIKHFHLKLSHISERQGERLLQDHRFSYLSLPCFSDFQLTKTDRGLILQAKLRRAMSDAISASNLFDEEILFLEFNEIALI